MTIGERIRYFRTRRGITQKNLGIQLGFPAHSADIRIAQYESGTRTPKADIIEKLADIFNVSASAITVPDIRSNEGIMQTFFALEDAGMLNVAIDSEGHPAFLMGENDRGLSLDITEWARKYTQLYHGEISQEEYNEWRYKLKATQFSDPYDNLK